MSKKKSEMRQLEYRGFTIYEVKKGKFQVGIGLNRMYLRVDSSLGDSKQTVDRIIKESNDPKRET